MMRMKICTTLHNMKQNIEQKRHVNVRECTKFINEELYGLYFSLNITSVMI